MHVAHLFADDICEYAITVRRRATAVRMMMLHNESVQMVPGTVNADE